MYKKQHIKIFGRTHNAPPSVYKQLEKGDFALWGGGEKGMS